MNIEFDEFLISDDKAILDFDAIFSFLSRSYWANKRSKDKIRKSFEASVCIGVYHGGKQVGIARLVTDHATVYWLCDVFVDEEYRGRGIGKKLIESITTSEEYRNLLGILGTRDAHGLYESYDFTRDNGRLMSRMPDFLRS